MLNTIVLGFINTLWIVSLCKFKSGPKTILQVSAVRLKCSFVNDSVMCKSYSWVIKKEYEDLIIIHWV